MLIVLTRIWPSADRPSLGSFVRDRVRGLTDVRVVKPRSNRAPWPLLYAVLFVDALRVRGRISGIEAHMAVPTGLVGLAVARLRRVPLVVYAHGRDVRGWDTKPAPIRWLTRLVLRRADRVVTNSNDTAAYIRKMGVEPIIAPPGVDLGRFPVRSRPGTGRVLYLGGRNARKGYAVAVELADTLVGPFLRDVRPEEIPGLMAQHDVVLVPSVAEPFGLVAVEAIASGRWVVASDVGGLRDIVIDEVNGTLVADGNFAAALRRVPDYDPAAVAATAERYSLERWQTAMAEIWNDLRGRASEGP
ncbi:MAG: glycosyltransferase family 4 protein [Chloroflexi bacterium]|nr:glycosyltransferase family 4 protein [Chloroflexota bacterium]